MTTITRRYRFCASHRLHSSALSAAENESTYGKCNNPYGHGHDYVLDVSVTGEINATTGLIVRISVLDTFVANEVLSGFAYRNLNDVPEFTQLVPTTENVAVVIAQRLKQGWADYFPYSSAYVSGVYILETDRNSFEVLLPKESPLSTRKNVLERSKLEEDVIVHA